MAFQKNPSLLLFLFLLGLGLTQPSYGQNQRFQWQHVDSAGIGGTTRYCNSMMHRRGMTSPRCKPVNTFIHESFLKINSICHTPNIRCKNGSMNCHGGTMRVTDCRDSGTSRSPNCRYQATTSTRYVIIACSGNPSVPVHFDR